MICRVLKADIVTFPFLIFKKKSRILLVNTNHMATFNFLGEGNESSLPPRRKCWPSVMTTQTMLRRTVSTPELKNSDSIWSLVHSHTVNKLTEPGSRCIVI